MLPFVYDIHHTSTILGAVMPFPFPFHFISFFIQYAAKQQLQIFLSCNKKTDNSLMKYINLSSILFPRQGKPISYLKWMSWMFHLHSIQIFLKHGFQFSYSHHGNEHAKAKPLWFQAEIQLSQKCLCGHCVCGCRSQAPVSQGRKLKQLAVI